MPTRNDPRGLRSDARRNREHLIAAARTVFADKGIDAPLEAVARAAGVSIGTLYNRFPRRDELVAAACLDLVENGVTVGERAMAMPDPWEAFAWFMTTVCELQVTDRGYADVCARDFPDAPAIGEVKQRASRNFDSILARAKASGDLRADFTAEDAALAMAAVVRTAELSRPSAPDAWRRHLAFLLDGLRASAAHPGGLPSHAPTT